MLRQNVKLTLMALIPLTFVAFLLQEEFGKNYMYLRVPKEMLSKLTDLVQEENFFWNLELFKSFVQEEKNLKDLQKEIKNNFETE